MKRGIYHPLRSHLIVTTCTKECLKIIPLKSRDSLINKEKKKTGFFSVFHKPELLIHLSSLGKVNNNMP